jgi:hypothetical protein
MRRQTKQQKRRQPAHKKASPNKPEIGTIKYNLSVDKAAMARRVEQRQRNSTISTPHDEIIKCEVTITHL